MGARDDTPGAWLLPPQGCARGIRPHRLQDLPAKPGRRLHRARKLSRQRTPRPGGAQRRVAVQGPAAAQERQADDRRMGADQDRLRPLGRGSRLAPRPLRAHFQTCCRTPRTTLLGMAKPIPTLPWPRGSGLNRAEVMPITRPAASIRGPPELPGLIGASVWMKRRSSPWASARLVALTMPAVTVWPRPNGLPIATTLWPTASLALSPSGSALRFFASMRSTARSSLGTSATGSAATCRPSFNPTSTARAFWTTWKFVTTRPRAASTMTPEPDAIAGCSALSGTPKYWRKKGSRRSGFWSAGDGCSTAMLTTAGAVFFTSDG